MARGPLPARRSAEAVADTPGADADPRRRRPLDGSALDFYADLYLAAARAFQWPPAEVDRLEVWQFYSALGWALSPAELDDLDAERDEKKAGRRRSNGRGRVRSGRGRDLIAERIAHARGEGPKPEADPPGDEVLALAMTMGARGGATRGSRA